jgi:hypothetical protein
VSIKYLISVFWIVLLLLIGLSAGFVLRGSFPAGRNNISTFTASSGDSSTGNGESDNFSLLNAGEEVADALRRQDYEALADYIDPDSGVTITPYSTVNKETDIVLTSDDLLTGVKKSTSYVWGTAPGTGDPIKQTVSAFFSQFLWNTDYTSAPEIGIDTVLYTGNAQENVADAYPDCRFIDFYVPGQKETNKHWTSLKLVFRWKERSERWYLVGIVHSEWMA